MKCRIKLMTCVRSIEIEFRGSLLEYSVRLMEWKIHFERI